MKNLLLILLTFFALQVGAQTTDVIVTKPVPLTGSNANNQTQSYANFKAYLTLYVPKGNTWTLNGGKDSVGAIRYNTSLGKLGVYKGSNTWEVLGGGGSYTASNGLTLSGSNFKLGGVLTEPITTIGSGGTNGSSIILSNAISAYINGDGTSYSAVGLSSLEGSIGYQGDSKGSYIKLREDSMIVEDQINRRGLGDKSDYSATKAPFSYSTKKMLTDGLATKQETLASGTSIKTINGATVLGSGNISTVQDLSPYQLVSNIQNNLTSSSTKYPSVDAVNTGLGGKQNNVSLTTTGSGAATFNSSTGALNIPTPVSSGGTVTSFGKSDGIGIISSVSNPTVAPIHTIRVDTTAVRTVANSLSLAATQTALNGKANLAGGNTFASGVQNYMNNQNTAHYADNTIGSFPNTKTYAQNFAVNQSATLSSNLLYNGLRFYNSGYFVSLDMNTVPTGNVSIDIRPQSGTMALTSDIVSTTGINVIDANTTKTLDVTGYYTYAGSTPTTWTLPVVSGNTMKRYVIMNTGTGTITLNTNGGLSVIYAGALVNSITIGTAEIAVLYNNSQYWVRQL